MGHGGVSGGVILVCFALSALGEPVLGRAERSHEGYEQKSDNSLPQKHKVSRKDIIVLPSWKSILMYSGQKGVDKAVTDPERSLHLLVEPEPWLRIFLRYLADSFEPAAPPAWITSRPGKYWADALVHRPVSWTSFRQSVLGHILLVLSVYGLHLTWINQPHVLPDEPQTHAVLHYELSEYLPRV